MSAGDYLDRGEARDIVGFDPFGTGEEEPNREEEEEEVSEEESEEESGEESEEESGEEEEEEEREETPPTRGLSTEQMLQQQNAFLQQQIQAMAQGRAPEAKPDSKDEKKEDEIPSYAFEIPDALVNAIRSEDPAHTRLAIQHLVAQTGRAVHQVLREEYRGHVQGAIQSYVQNYMVQREQQREIEQDFYGTYPEFNSPAGRQLVTAVSQQVLKEMRPSAWTPEVRDAIAERARASVAGLAGGQNVRGGAEQDKQKQQRQRKRPAKQVSTSTRPGTEKRPNSLADEVQDTLFGSG